MSTYSIWFTLDPSSEDHGGRTRPFKAKSNREALQKAAARAKKYRWWHYRVVVHDKKGVKPDVQPFFGTTIGMFSPRY